MKCIICESEMENIDDVNNISNRIDWMICPKCGTKAEIIYSNTEIPFVKNITFGR